ncbi:biliverdin-producing heme oxygenase [Moraxella equi]|uniref:Heme oxygenase n=1 Tax=Moraxella equi TaxID=60442 RepID=A0A378QV01_9GAMM|nr:biliverdin-producing heme oxygenase [Moraxella equi]OPH37848.1 heme oxygenase [Moraxella equi]STZ04124.1 Heme oxygenase [Moraxella equi]
MSELTLTEALKEHSRTTHDAVDNLVMSMEPFASHDNYRKFLQAQYEFHSTVNPIYHNEKLASQIDGLAELARLDRVKSDMKDLEATPFDRDVETPTFTDSEAIGWLYCVEGSNVGAAILYKEAGKIDLSDEFGASHLAAHADGRMPHWRATKAKINALPLSDDDKQSAMKGADDAFAYFKRVIRKVYGTQA